MLPEQPSINQNLRADRKSLAIALFVAAVFLLAALGLATWLFMQKQQNSQAAQPATNPESVVTSVSWVAPASMPAAYSSYDYSTANGQVLHFANTADGCSLTTRVVASTTTEDLAARAAKLNDSEGITTKTVAGEGQLSITIKDADDQTDYAFAGAEFDQDVQVPGVDFTSQSGAVYYRQFGSTLATISFSCKAAGFELNAQDLTTLAEQFTIKTE